MKRQDFYSEVEAFSRYLRSKPYSYKGQVLDPERSLAWAHLLLLQTCLLYDLTSGQSPLDTHRRCSAFIKQSSNLDVFAVGKYLKTVKTSWCEAINGSCRFHLNGDAEQMHCHEVWMAPLGGLFRKSLIEKDPAVCFQVNTWISFLARADLKIDMEEELLEEYLADEERFSNAPLPLERVGYLRQILHGWLEDYGSYNELYIPKHGPGSVAELKGRPSVYEKESLLTTDDLLDLWVNWRTGVPARWWYTRECDTPLERTSVLRFVPKSLTTMRTISKEPASLAFWQQAVKGRLYRYFEDHPVLSQHIRLRDAGASSELARRGSDLFGPYATIDLSKASDSVTLRLVEATIGGTALWPDLIATRSTHTLLPNGETIELAKFAPMGSALCFPVETLIFSALTEAACREAGLDHPRYLVYGDDIVVPDRAAAILLEWLDAFGFIPNRHKSFWKHTDVCNFREACGGEYFNGVDITPVRLPREFLLAASYHTEDRPAVLAQLADVCRTLNDSGLKKAALVLMSTAKTLDVPIPTHPNILGFDSNYVGKERWNQDLWRTEHRFQRPTSRVQPVSDDSWRYAATLRSHIGRLEPDWDSEPHVVQGGRARPAISWVWEGVNFIS